MSSVNKVILLGNLGNDPEQRQTHSGKAVTNFSLATSETWKDKQTGEKQERTEWHRVVFFGRVADIAAQYLAKGSKVYVEGSLQTDKYTKDGVERYTTKVVGRDLRMLNKAERTEEPNTNQEQTETGGTFCSEEDIPF